MKPKCLMFVTDGFEDMEVLFTMHRFREAGYQVVLASLKGTTCTGLHGYQVHPDSPIRELNPAEYEWLVIPGGACSEKLRLREEVLDIARTQIEDGRKVASIGRGVQVLLSAGAIDAKRIACPHAIRDDIRASGGIWVDVPSVVEGNLHSCRSWQDLPHWFQTLFGNQPVSQSLENS
ncbi:MAG: DJ-1/PfpI family protein [Gemmataceae bacterium]|nr:DJ-1/PfpI family protein [Planctomycetota bacterium]